jgi:putative transposase
MSKKTKTPSFIHEFQLITTPKDNHIPDTRLDAGRHLHNACLGEALKRLTAMRRSKEWHTARTMTKGKKRNPLFSKSRDAANYTEYSLHNYVGILRNSCWIGEHIDSLTAQKVATRAFQAVEDYQFGKHVKPRFKRKGWMSSLEGKNNKSGILWRTDHIEWSGLSIPCIFDLNDKFGVQAHALNHDVKYVRLVKKTIRGNTRWFAQLVLKGTAKIKRENQIGAETVGLDIGPSTVAVVSDSDAMLLEFCPEVEIPYKQIRITQRKMARSLRANNPDNYSENGTFRPGKKQWVFSTQYWALKSELAELQRILAETRKRAHGRLVNKVLKLGTNIKTEKLSYKAFQKLFGKSVSRRAPGMFISTLRRKAENAGGKVNEFATQSTKLSQACPCGEVKKKPLSQRQHICKCGVMAQRDLYSGFLAKYVFNDILDTRQAAEAWPSANLLLERAVSRLQQQAVSGRIHPASFGVNRRQNRSHVKDGSTTTEIGNRISVAKEVAGTAVRTPWL